MKKRAILNVFLILSIAAVAYGQSSAAGSSRRRSTTNNAQLIVNTNLATSAINVRGQGGASNSFISSGSSTNLNAQGSFNQQLSQGSYTITVSAPGYYTETREINLSGNQTLNVNLRMMTADVTIRIPSQFIAKEPGAVDRIRFYDNGELLQGGPVYRLSPGQHTIRIESGGLWIQGTFNFEAGKTYIIEPTLSLGIR